MSLWYKNSGICDFSHIPEFVFSGFSQLRVLEFFVFWKMEIPETDNQPLLGGCYTKKSRWAAERNRISDILKILLSIFGHKITPTVQSTANQISLCAGFRCLCLSALDVSVLWLMLSHNNRNVSGEWVFCYQGAYPFLHKRKTGSGIFVSLHLFPHLEPKL